MSNIMNLIEQSRGMPGFSAANSAAIFDEITVTVLTPVEIFSFEEITD